MSLQFKPAFAGAKTIYMSAQDLGALDSGWQARGTWTAVPNVPPSAVSVTPNSGSGYSQTFSFLSSDGNGHTDLSYAYLYFGTSGNWCTFYTNPAGYVYLLADDGQTWLGPVTFGGATNIQNSRCALNANGSSQTKSGNDWTVHLALSFQPVFAGAKEVRMLVVDNSGAQDSQTRGTWTVGPSGVPITVTTYPANLAISVDSSSYTAPQTFNWAAGSNHTIAVASPQGSAGTRYQFANWSDTGAQSHSITTPAIATTYTAVFTTQRLLTRQVSPPGSGTLIASPYSPDGYYGQGTTVQLTAAAGAGYQFANFSGDLSGSTNPQSLVMSAPRTVTANFTATGGNRIPGVGGVTPSAGNQASQVFTFTFSDPDGWQDLGVVNVLINFWLDGRNSCYLAYSRPLGVLYLVNDAGGALSELALGGAGSVSNSQCTVYGTGSSASGSGNTLTVTLNMSFNASYAGAKILYLAARDAAESNSGWQRMGTWTVPGAAASSPAVVGMTPQRGSGSSQAFTFQFSDTDGYADLGVLNILVNDWLDGRNACYIAYSRPLGVLYLVNDGGTALLPELVLGSGGSVNNSQCTIYGTGSSASGSGSTLTLTLNMSFAGAFAGNRAFYLAARDAAEHNSGWQALGTWTVP